MNIDTRYDLLQGAQKQQQAQKNQSTQSIEKVQAVENGQTATETVEAVKAPRYDTVNIDEQGFDALASSLQAQQETQAVKTEDTSDEEATVTQAASMAQSATSASELAVLLAKVQAGQALSSSELSVLKENSPADYARAVQASQGSAAQEKIEIPQEIQGAQTRAMSMAMPTEE